MKKPIIPYYVFRSPIKSIFSPTANGLRVVSHTHAHSAADAGIHNTEVRADIINIIRETYYRAAFLIIIQYT